VSTEIEMRSLQLLRVKQVYFLKLTRKIFLVHQWKCLVVGVRVVKGDRRQRMDLKQFNKVIGKNDE